MSGRRHLADDLRADDEVAERTRHPVGQPLAPVERKGEHVRCLVDPEVLLLQRPALLRRHEGEPELALLDSLRGEHPLGELDCTGLVDLGPAPVFHVNRDRHRFRAVPVSSAWSLYASTIRCTSLR